MNAVISFSFWYDERKAIQLLQAEKKTDRNIFFWFSMNFVLDVVGSRQMLTKHISKSKSFGCENMNAPLRRPIERENKKQREKQINGLKEEESLWELIT